MTFTIIGFVVTGLIMAIELIVWDYKQERDQ